MRIFINNIYLNYEVIGKGKPIIFLHGNNENLNLFKEFAKMLNNKCYLIDSRCHGKSCMTDRLSYDDMANDIHEFIKINKIKKPTIIGFSDGAIISLILESKYHILGKIIALGANINPNGLIDSEINNMKQEYSITLDNKLRLMIEEPIIDKLDINIPTYLFYGKNDCIKEEHMYYIKSLIKKSNLTILNNQDHYSYVKNKIMLYSILNNII